MPPQAISVTVRHGVVTLAGEVEHRSDAGIAVRTARQVDGVVAVDDQLTFRLDDPHVQVSEQSQHGVADDWLRKLLRAAHRKWPQRPRRCRVATRETR
nr:BON domain-containing protein [Streptomyces sp. Tu102]